MKSEMKDADVRELMADIRTKLEKFVQTFTNYLKGTEIAESMKGLITNLNLELYVKKNEEVNVWTPLMEAEIEGVLQIKTGKKYAESFKETRENKRKNESKSKHVFVEVNEGIQYSTSKRSNRYCIMWEIVLPEGFCKAEYYMAQVLLDSLKECFVKDLADLDLKKSALKRRARELNLDFFNKYAEKLFHELPIPKEDIVRKLSYQSYEQSEVFGTIYFTKHEGYNTLPKEKKDGLVWIPDDERKDMNQIKNISGVRKMLEVCKAGSVLLVEKEKKKGQYLIAAVAKKEEEKEWSRYKIEFCKKGEWKLYISEEVVLEYREGVYCLGKKRSEDEAMKKVGKINVKEVRKNEKKFREIFQRLHECPHGALLILGETKVIQGEVKRLSQLHKGMSLGKSGLDLKEECNLSIFQGLASVDGAVMVDYNGVCYGYGMILDGVAITEGDIGRGARYNSGKNYSAIHKEYAVIFSEDKEKGIQVFHSGKNV